MSSAPQPSRGVGHGVACAHLAARPGCGSPQGAGWGGGGATVRTREDKAVSLMARKCPLPRPLPPTETLLILETSFLVKPFLSLPLN